MFKHTTELWYKVIDFTPRGTIVTDIITGNTIIAQLKCDEGKAYAARIVACVNACAGMEYPELQIQQLKTGNALLELERIKLTARIAELEEQLKQKEINNG